MKKFGLIGFPLGHSFSKKYYDAKISNEHIKEIDYSLLSLENIGDFPLLYQRDPDLFGVNVTIPHKQSIIPFLDTLSEEAQQIGAVNCITIRRDNDGAKPILKGYNTDAYGFEYSLKPLLKPKHSKALVLGNGGAAKAVIYVLNKLGIQPQLVSRSKQADTITYNDLNPELVKEYLLIVNCSPLGTYPEIDYCPDIPYEALTPDHYLYDLIYNPEETLFLKKGKDKGATIKNGYEMLVLQAEKNWEIWLS